jgi:hypothetical protein
MTNKQTGNVTPCDFVGKYQYFKELSAAIFRVEDGSSRLLQNFGIYLIKYTMPHARTL